MTLSWKFFAPHVAKVVPLLSIVLSLLGSGLAGWQIWQAILLRRVYLASAATNTESASLETQPVTEKLVVSVVGAVNNPSVLVLSSDARISDALTAAGGIASVEAKPDFYQQLNLAEKVKDGQQIVVPFTSSLPSTSTPDQETAHSTDKVAINVASKTQLDQLPGLGEVRIQKLLEMRPFSSWEDLKERLNLPESVVNNLQEKASL